MKRARIYALAVSVFLHLVALGALYFTIRSQPPRAPSMTIEIVEPPPSGDPARPQQLKAYKVQSQIQQKQKRSLSKFKPKLYGSYAGSILAPVSSEDGGATDDAADTGWGAGGSQFKRIEDYGLMDQIYRNVDNILFYPGVLAEHKIEGAANARIVLDQAGNCDWDATSISANDAHLRIYILDVLKKSCRQSFARFVRNRKRTNIDLSFKFEITEHSDPKLIANQKKIVGNVLLFYRNAQHSVLQWKVGPFQGLFPIPWVAVDFMWLQKHWDELQNGPKDDMREFRDRGQLDNIKSSPNKS